MKSIFNGFYSPTDKQIKEEWESNSTLFVFDTNVLLNLYSYTPTTREDFFHIIKKISSNIWLPYHVALEYQRNRLTVIKNEKSVFNDINTYLESIEKNLHTNKIQELKLNQRLPALHDKIEKMHSDVKNLIKECQKEVQEWDKKQPEVRSTDEIRKQLDKLFDTKVGDRPIDQNWLNSLYEEGKQRYEKEIPPGYKDMKEKEDRPNYLYAGLEYVPIFGDLIIWKQIIEKVAIDKIKTLIFITDDVKEDWWYILNSNGKKEIGARAELRDEIHRNSDIENFQILRTTDFLKFAKELTQISIKDTSIQETKSNFENKRKEYNVKIDEDVIRKLAELESNIYDKYNIHKSLYDENNFPLKNQFNETLNEYIQSRKSQLEIFKEKIKEYEESKQKERKQEDELITFWKEMNKK